MRAVILGLAVWLFSPAPAGSNTPVNVPALACTPELAGGDVILNALKDRTTQVPAPIPASIDQIADYPAPSVLTGLARARWSLGDAQLARQHENTGVQAEGYVVGEDSRPFQPWNCNGPWSDTRIWIAASPAGSRLSAVIAVFTPAWKQANSGWSEAELQRLARERAHVRVTGHMLYADDDAVELLLDRRTLWEIHPVTRLEVESGGGWSEIVDAASRARPPT